LKSTSNKTTPFTFWFTGLSASGKTTLSERLYQDLKDLGLNNIILLDGDIFRDQIKNHNYDSFSRSEIHKKKLELASKLNSEGKIVLISGISHKKETRRMARLCIENYYEIFLSCNVQICAHRDFKNLYSRAFSGEINNFVGVNIEYEVDEDSADLTINTGEKSIEDCAQIILDNVRKVLSLDF